MYRTFAQESAMRFAARRLAVAAAIVSFALLSAAPANAQGIIADYQRAMDLRERFTGLALDVAGAPSWIEGWSARACASIRAASTSNRPPACGR